MCVAVGVFVELEEVSQVLQREMPLHLFLVVDHTRAEGLLVRLSLKDLFLNTASLQANMSNIMCMSWKLLDSYMYAYKTKTKRT